MPNSEPSSSPVPRWKSGLVHTLSLLLIWQPMLLSAQPITPTHGTNGRPTLDQAANGVPVVNIQNPNGKGVSQNFYNDLNVSDKGLVLNNSQTLTQTQLGGYIEGNPNLKNGSASLILNEVIGQNPSNLAGYIEVGGARADVVVANPNGISCNGCGFINTNHATLTTGQSIMEDGELRGFDVQGGAVSILGEGLNASNTERFDIIARSVTLAGELHADRLNIVTGQQKVGRQTLATSNATSDGDKPQFAIDSSALGGMYANRIRLIANEDGVGVKLDAPVAAQNGDLQLSANGKIQHSDLAATGNIAIDTNQHDVSGTGTVWAQTDLSVKAADYTNSGYVVADGKADIQATTVTNTGTLGGREALTVEADAILNDQGGALLSENDINLSADQVTNRLADIYTSGNLTINGNDGESAEKLENRSGRIEAEGDVAVQAEQILNVRDVLDWQDVLVDAKAQYFCIECQHTNFTMRYTFTEEFVRELDEATTGRSLLVAGGDMSLVGEELVNETSDILAYGDMNLDVDRIDNIGLHSGEYVLINHYKTYLSDNEHVANVRYGIEPYNKRNYFGGARYWGSGGNKKLEHMALFASQNNPNYDPDNFLRREDNWVVKRTPHIGEEIVPLESAEILGANIISGGNLDMGDAAVTNGDLGHKQGGGVSEEELIAVGKGAGRGGNDMDSYLEGANGGLFSIADPNHPYLIETNPFFSTRDGFLGSEYLLNRLGWDPNGAMRLLGDGFYEQQLIRQQVVDLTGRALLDEEYVDANAQYRALLDNGLFAAEELELTVGVALSPDQVNALTEDMVWMVEQEVAGEIVLVPQLYLSPQSAVIDDNGALIASGGDMVNDGGSIVNSGTIHFGGDADFDLNEDGLQNLGGTISGEGVLDIDSEGDVRNISGTISAREVALNSAQDIINRRLAYQSEIADGTGWREWHTEMGAAATIEGADYVDLDAEGDIRITGSRIRGGNVALNAEGDIVVDTVADQSGRKGNYHGGKLSESRVRHIGSEITATMNLLASAGNDFRLLGSDLASDGGVQLSAGNDLLVASVANSDSYDFKVRHDGETSHNIQRSVRQQGASITGGGDVVMESGNDLTVIASRLEAGEDLSLIGKGDISILAALDSDYLYSYEEDKGSFGRKRTETTETSRQDVVGSQLAAQGDVLINASKDKQGRLVGYEAAEGDVTFTSADVRSQGDTLIASAGSLTFDSAANTYSHEHHKTKKGTISARQSGQSTLSITHQGTSLQSGGDVQMMGLNGITLENTDVSASGDLIASAGLYSTQKETLTNDQADLLIRDVHDIYQYDSYKESSKADIGGMVASMATLGLGGGLATFNPLDFADVTKATMVNALNGEKGYTQASGSYSATSQGSNLDAQGSLLLQSAGDMHIQGSTVSGLRDSGEGEVEVQGSTALLAGTLINPRDGQTVLTNDEANLSIIAGENHHSSYYEKEKFGVDYLGAAGGAITQMAGAATGAFSGDFSGPDDLPDDVSIKREGEEQRTESVTLTQSVVQDNQHLTLSAGNDMTAVASQILSGGNMAMTAGGDVNLAAGLETLSDYQASYGNSFDNFTGGYDRGRLYAGIEGERYRQETLFEQGKALGSLLQVSGLINMQVDGDVNVIGSDFIAGGLDADIGGEMRFGAAQEYERTTHKSTNEDTSLTAGVGNSYVDAAYAADDFVKASEDVKRAYDALQAAKDDPRITDISDYEANLTLALLQQQAVGIQAATSVSGAVENAPSFGFYGDVQMATETTEHTSTSEALTHRGSQVQLGAGGMNLKGEALTLQGSRLDIHDGGGLDLDVDRFTVEAVADTYSNQSSTETHTSTLTIASSSRSNLAGAAAVDALSGGLGTQSSEQQSQSQYWQYGAVNVDGLMNLDVKDQTTIHGGNVWAREVTGNTGNLSVTSLQNTSTSEHSNRGLNLGGGQGFSANGGYNTTSGSSERAWVDQVSSFHGEEAFDLRVDGHTQVDGAVISGGDPDNFTLDTGTFAYTDIQDYDRGSNSGWGVSTSFNPLDLKEQQKAPQGSTTLSTNRNGHDKEGITRATMGEGTLIVRDEDSDKNSDLAGLNRDTDNVQEITRDEITGGLDAELTLDHRLVTERGRMEIARDVSTTLGMPQDMVTSVIKVLGDRKITELGVLIHEHGLTRKLTEEIKRFPEYDALRKILADTMGVPEDQTADRLRTLLAEIGSVAAENPEQLQQAIAGFTEAGEQGIAQGVKDGSALKIALHQAVGEALGGADGASAAGINEMLMPLLVDLAGNSPERLRALSRIVGGASSGNAQGAWIAEQGTTWNRQLHQNEVIAIRDQAKAYAEKQGISESEAL
ncbi:hemagglutinin repeat-containing protein, partial [Marinobacter sp. Hex_13]|uniref:two-partner secretion domain-containing protein n=1 Tax=Marinobacter sp. Hex_13 TaxID=1795866 RepID=UPI00257E0C35